MASIPVQNGLRRLFDRVAGYVLAIISTCSCAAISYGLERQSFEKGSMMLFVPAVLITAWYGGVCPGVFATALGVFFSAWLLIPPITTVNLGDHADKVAMILYMVISLGIVALAGKERNEKRNRQKAQAELERVNQSLEARVQARTSELETANQELERFCYNVSHDLRTPARAIVGNAHILLQDYNQEINPSLRDRLHRISSSAVRLSDLVDALLVYARLAKAGLRPEGLNLGDIVAEEARSCADLEGRIYNLDKPTGMFVVGDRKQLRTAISAILANSMKFAKRDNPVYIQVGFEQNGSEVIVSFRDNGVGFDARYIHKVFEPFERLHRDEDYPGVGMGLANVARIVDRHHGSVWAESKLGEGSCIYMKLVDQPVAKASVKQLLSA